MSCSRIGGKLVSISLQRNHYRATIGPRSRVDRDIDSQTTVVRSYAISRKGGGPNSALKGRICVIAPNFLPGPTNSWALLHMPTPHCHVAPHTGVRVDLRGHVWPPATCMRPVRRLRLAWATRSPATWPQCHVASARWSHATRQLATWTCSSRHHLQVSKPFFRDFNK